MLGSTSGMRRQ